MSVQMGGLLSGLDTGQIVSQLVQLERAPIRRLQGQRQAVQRDLEQVSTISTAMNELSQTLNTISNPSETNIFKANVSQEDALGISLGSGAVASSFNVEIHQLAQAAQQRSTGFSGGEVREGTLEIFASGEDPVIVEIAAGSSLEDVRNQINASDASVRATVINTGAESFLSVTATNTGHTPGSPPSEALQITETYTGSGQELNLSTVQQAQNAQFEVDGLSIERSDNRFNDVIDGVEFDLQQAGTGTITVDLAADRKAAVEQLEKLTEDYNAVVAALRELSRGGLQRMAIQQLRTAIGDDLAALSLAFTRTGELQVDQAGLEALMQDPEAIQNVFEGETGLNARMQATLDGYAGPSGVLAGTREGLESSSRQFDLQIERRERSVEMFRDRIQRQFTQLEQAMAQMQDSQMRLASLMPTGMMGAG